MSLHADPPVKKNMSRRHFALRLNLFFFASFILFAILIIQLAVLQFVRSPALQEEESKSGQRDIEIPPARGNILDSSGQPIAYSISSQSLYFSIQPGFKEEDAEALAARLSEAFAEYGSKEEPAMTSGDIIRQMDLGHSRNSYTVPRRIKSGLSQGEIAYFSENRDLYQGIDIVEESVRHYDQSTIAVQLVGYLKKYKGVRESVDKYKQKQEETDPALQLLDDEDVGMDGLEYMYQDQLRGKNGLKTYPVDASSLIIGPPKITKPVRGDDIYLTINRNVQLSTEQAITDQLKTLQTAASSPLNEGKNAKTGYAVAMEVNTGKIVAMASMPDYNPNVWAGGKISEEDLKNIEYYQYNGTIRQVYAPYDSKKERDRHPPSLVYLGSTQKPLSVMIGLQEGLFTTGSVYSDTGVYYFGKKGHEVPIHNSDNHAYGQLHPYQAIAKSSNTFMSAMVGDRLLDKYGAKSVDVWDSYMKQFGLGVSTESGLPGESAGVIDYYHEAEAASRQSALVRASFGQQGRYTALQLAQYASMLANGGKRMQPQFVNEIRGTDGSIIQGFEPKVLNTISFPQKYWDEIYKGMSQVKVEGFEGVNYTFLRKTGTSEQDAGDRKKVENAVLIAFAPAEDPVLAVAVIVPDGGFGGWGAAPIARQIFDAYDAETGRLSGKK